MAETTREQRMEIVSSVHMDTRNLDRIPAAIMRWINTGEDDEALVRIGARYLVRVEDLLTRILATHTAAAVERERERCHALAVRAVESAVDAALGEVRRQGGPDYLLREARGDGIGGADVFLGAIRGSLPSPPLAGAGQGEERIRLLVKAGALIVAEIERLQRASGEAREVGSDG